MINNQIGVINANYRFWSPANYKIHIQRFCEYRNIVPCIKLWTPFALITLCGWMDY